MKSTDYALVKEITAKQEEMLRFSSFTNKDALKLGNMMAKRVYDIGIDLGIVIRKLNGLVVYQHITEGASQNNVNWMNRKFNTCALTEMSSLRAWATFHLNGETVEDCGLSSTEYVLCGGGFPIRMKGGELVGVITVSNLPHEQDHQFIVDVLKEYLAVEGMVPEISFDK